MQRIRNILLVGGTHGNEMTGIHLVRNWLRDSSSLKHEDLDVQLLLANPEAIQACRRYVETDLNRAFSKALLAPESNAKAKENLRAREIHAQFANPDLVIDLHNSTANMGICLILNHLDEPVRRICAILAKEFEEVRILYQPEPEDSLSYLPSIGQRDITVEVGPQPHGMLRASLYERTRLLVLRLLELVSLWNSQSLDLIPIPTRIFIQIGTHDYPRDSEGHISAMIHPTLEGRDFLALTKGAPVFLTFDNQTIPWNEETIYPCFIGEAAYLEKRIAFSVLQSSEELW